MTSRSEGCKLWHWGSISHMRFSLCRRTFLLQIRAKNLGEWQKANVFLLDRAISMTIAQRQSYKKLTLGHNIKWDPGSISLTVLRPYAQLLCPAPNFWEAFYWLKTSAQGAKKWGQGAKPFMKSTPGRRSLGVKIYKLACWIVPKYKPLKF